MIKAILTAIAAFANVFTKLASAAERGATALDEVARAGEVKAKNFAKLVELNDDAEFNERKAELEARRAALKEKGIQVTDMTIESEQAIKAGNGSRTVTM